MNPGRCWKKSKRWKNKTIIFRRAARVWRRRPPGFYKEDRLYGAEK